MSSRARYKVKCLKDGKIFDSVKELCEFYGMSPDAVYYRLDKPSDYEDGYNFERIYDNTEALESIKSVNSKPFVDKFGDKTVPVPGYEDRYTISTSGVITNIRMHNKILPVKSTVVVRNTVILHSDNKTQTHNVENLMKKAFGDPEEMEDK